jgi:serine/threonine protein kinase
MAKAPDIPPPKVPDHELLRCIGTGSFGEVWLARNIMGTFRAVKIIHRAWFAEDRPFEREFEGMGKFEPVARTHPGLVAILHVGRVPDGSCFYYIMEVADDVDSGPRFDPDRYKPHTLAAELNRRGRLPFDECLRIGIALSLALDHLHTRGLVHRDIKPSNIILVNRTPKLADIGLVAGLGERSSLVGTCGFIPPTEPGTAGADVFALGKVLYQLATGRAVEGFPELPTTLREESVPQMFLLNQIILKACELDPRARYQSAFEVHSALVAARQSAETALPASNHRTRIPSRPPSPTPTPARRPDRKAASFRVTILYKPAAEPDNHVRDLLEARLADQNCEVLADKSVTFSVQWAREIEDNIQHSDAVVVLLTEASVQSEMLGYEVELAHLSAQRSGKPLMLPVRLNFTGPLPDPLGSLLAKCRCLKWTNRNDDERLVSELAVALTASAQPRPSETRISLEASGGAVPLDSHFYVVRSTDEEFQKAITRGDSIVLVKGARQIGKTSLLARGLQQARQSGARVVLTDFQKLNSAHLASVDAFFRALGDFLADQLNLDVLPDATWDKRRSPNTNFERYLRREVLDNLQVPLVWGLDEVDRLFSCEFGGEVFGLFRSWHNERALDPSGPWSRLTLAIAYATEAHLFITDLNQSPFNVGTRLDLEDFTLSQVDDLNQRHGAPMKHDSDVVRFHELLGGHPYLVRRGLNEMASGNVGLDLLVAQADRDEGIFGDHLRRMLVLLARDPEMTEVVRGVLRGRPCPDAASFYRLRSAGLMRGESFQQVQPRCAIYAAYLRRHLP